MRVIRLPEFVDWIRTLDPKGRAQVDARILRIEHDSHFGDAKDLGDGLAELRWANGWRVYFARIYSPDGSVVLLILGGNKNGQTKDIRRARIFLQRYAPA